MAEIVNNGAGGTIVNYSVSGRKGKIYRSSKTEEDGFEKVIMDSGAVVWHKYVDGLCGKITYLARAEKEFTGNDGKTKKLDNLKLFVNDGETTCALDVKTYSQEWKLLIKHLYNADFSKDICVGFYKKEVGEKSYINCYVKYSGEQTEDGKAVYPEWLDVRNTDKEGTVPPPTKNRKGEWDWTDNDIWYLDRMDEMINRFKDSKPSEIGAPKPSKPKMQEADPQKSFVPPTVENSGLPF